MMKSDPQKINALSVWLNDYQVGIINHLVGDKHLFSFHQEYIDDPNRPTLSLSFKGQTGGLVTSTRVVSLRLPPFFSNVLPEGHLRTYLAQRARVKPEREFFLLAALGADLPGALYVKPMTRHEQIDASVDHHELEDYQDDTLRFSLAGIQLKFSAVMEKVGMTIPANGMGGSWIVKLPSTRFPAVPENEFVMLALANAVGINVPEARLLEMKNIHGMPQDILHMEGNVLAVKRFDRGAHGKRIHMEDFAQVFGLFPDSKYDRRSYANIASVIWAEMGDEHVYEYIRRLIFSIMIGNADMHLKNWSILYPDTRTPGLSPGYDFVSTLPYLPGDRLALNFGGSRSLHEITADQLRRFVDTARLPTSPIMQLVKETVERTVVAWGSLDEKALLPRDLREAIGRHIEMVARNTTL